MIKLKSILVEKKKLEQRYLNKVHRYTQSNNHTQARHFLSHMMGNKRLKKFYNAMMELNDVFGGYGPELSKLNQKMEKELYKEIKKSFLNSAEVIGLL
jgi:uncharacterized protein YaaR (DUF327 family)|tara:strand:- start:185 stop:478 length:294 start_codon:yes stop_codon:yes gene_type:complete